MNHHSRIPGLPAQARKIAGRMWAAAASLHRAWRSRRIPSTDPPVLVVGSLRCGGSGKTDLVAHLAATRPDFAILVHPTGDEDRMLLARFPGRVFVHRDLLRAWDRARSAGFRAAVSDGGLQDPAFGRCPAVRLDHDPGPAGPEDLLPFGRFRALAAPGRARELVLVVGRDLSWSLVPDDLPSPGAIVRVACGIARPEAFVSDLRSEGIEVREVFASGDHGRFPSRVLAEIRRDPRGWCATEKDSFRHPLPEGVRVVRRKMTIVPEARGCLDALAASVGRSGD